MPKKFAVFLKSDKLMKGHLGLHDALPKSDFPVVPPKGEIWVNEKLKKRQPNRPPPEKRIKGVVIHEKFENYLMTEKGLRYKEAHERAKKFEKGYLSRFK